MSAQPATPGEIQISPGRDDQTLRVVALWEELRWSWYVYTWDRQKAIRAAQRKLRLNGCKQSRIIDRTRKPGA